MAARCCLTVGFETSGAQLFDIGRHRHRLDVVEREPAILAPIKELFHRPRIGHPGVAVADVSR